MADQVVVGSVVVELGLDELEQICQLGANDARVCRCYRVGGKVAPMNHNDVHGIPKPEERVLEFAHPKRSLNVVKPTWNYDFSFKHWIEARRKQVQAVPGSEEETVGMVATVEFEVSLDASPVPGSNVEGSMLLVVEL